MLTSWRPASPPLAAHPHPASIISSLALPSSTGSPAASTPLIRVLSWLVSILLALCMLLYVAYQLYHITLLATFEHAYSYRHFQARYAAAPLTAQSTHSPQQPQPATPAPLTTTPATPTTATTTPTTPYQPTFAILVLGDTQAATRYAQHWTSLSCYAHRHNYTFLALSNARPTAPHPCAAYDNFFFRKHCAVAQQLRLWAGLVDWVLVLDGDVFVVDAEPPLERWLGSSLADPRVDGEYVIHHYERFHNGEIMAGNYIVGNCARAVDYLMRWADWHNKIPQHGFHNFDNGALHLHILSYLTATPTPATPTTTTTPTPADYEHVHALYKRINSWAEYDAYIGAFRCLIGPHRLWSHIGLRIIRRGHFAVRDFFVASEGDRLERITNVGVIGGGEVMLHGWKESVVGVWWAEAVDGEACRAEVSWTPRLLDSVRVDMPELLRVVRERERYTVTDRGNAVAMQDVSDCFPQCPAELTAAQGVIVRQRLCPPGLREKYVQELAATAG